MKNDVNGRLFKFLLEQETGLYTQDFHKNKTVFAYVHIDFDRLSEFAEIVGSYPFEDGGWKVVMFERTICLELNDLLNGYLSPYKDIFHEDDWDEYKDRILEMEADCA